MGQLITHCLIYHVNVTVTSQWAPWSLKSTASGLFAKLFVHAHIKENIKIPRHWPLWGESTGDRLILLTKRRYARNVSISLRHHRMDNGGNDTHSMCVRVFAVRAVSKCGVSLFQFCLLVHAFKIYSTRGYAVPDRRLTHLHNEAQNTFYTTNVAFHFSGEAVYFSMSLSIIALVALLFLIGSKIVKQRRMVTYERAVNWVFQWRRASYILIMMMIMPCNYNSMPWSSDDRSNSAKLLYRRTIIKQVVICGDSDH